jgi:hypothetical protein
MMIERFTVRSFDKMPHHPTEVMNLVDEDYFNTTDECKTWCMEHLDIKDLNFQIHHSVGAKNYFHGIASGTGLITWLVRDYQQTELPTVACWWDIMEEPEHFDKLRKGI